MNPARCLCSTPSTSIPLFLAPAFAELTVTPTPFVRSFSSGPQCLARRRETNKRRGVSAMRSTGPRHQLSVQSTYKELPVPQAEEDRPLSDFPMNPNHGLYGFFKDKQIVLPPDQEELHGRAWEYHELVFKSFDDLHGLYWQALLERNRIKTRMVEFTRLKLGFGKHEIEKRLTTVNTTMRNIRRVLMDRQSAYLEAKLIHEQQGSMAKLDRWLSDEAEDEDRERQVVLEALETQAAQEVGKAEKMPKVEVVQEPEQAGVTKTRPSSAGVSPETPTLPPRPKF